MTRFATLLDYLEAARSELIKRGLWDPVDLKDPLFENWTDVSRSASHLITQCRLQVTACIPAKGLQRLNKAKGPYFDKMRKESSP